MNRRVDALLVAHPEHADGIRLLAERDPAGNLKYLAWMAQDYPGVLDKLGVPYMVLDKETEVQ